MFLKFLTLFGGTSSASGSSAVFSYLLLEDGNHLLLEDGSKLILE